MVAGCTTQAAGRGSAAGPPPGPAGLARLIAYDSCQQAMDGLRHAALGAVGAYGFAGNGYPAGDAVPDAPVAGDAVPAAPRRGAETGASRAAGGPPVPAHSDTNVAEPGVDEPDLVKTDGRRIVSVVDGSLRVVDAASRQLTGALWLPPGDAESQHKAEPAGLLLDGDRALVLFNRLYRYPVDGPVGTVPSAPEPPVRRDPAAVGPGPVLVVGSQLLLVDLTGSPRLLARLSLDGDYVDARQVGSTVRVVARSSPRLGFVYPDGTRPPGAAAAANRRVVQRSTQDDWLPRYDLDVAGHRSQGQVPCDRVSHPVTFAGSSLLTVYTFDLAGPADRVLSGGDPVTIVADEGNRVYGTATSLYVAGYAWRPTSPRTDVHRFDLSGPGRPRYAASGEVPGVLLNQYAMSEYRGHLRIATTTASPTVPGPVPCCAGTQGSQSAVRVLDQRGAALVEVGRVDGLGKGERISAVRFAGPVGYLVTFRQTDPLYTLDLRDPRHPRAVGELKIRGYSAYLHPAGDGRLIGIGQDATAHGQALGTQVSLFDVADPTRPRRLTRYRVPGGSSPVENDAHAFLYWPAAGLVVVPVLAPDLGPEGYPAALAMSLRGNALSEVGAVRHPTTGPDRYRSGISRALVVGDTLWTLSEAGLQANDLHTLTRRGWLPFS
jgi:hypothetical protein